MCSSWRPTPEHFLVLCAAAAEQFGADPETVAAMIRRTAAFKRDHPDWFSPRYLQFFARRAAQTNGPAKTLDEDSQK